jgi:hypothetical protein
MELKLIVIASLLTAVLALSGCTSPAATPSPSAAAPTATPVATPTFVPPADTPVPTPVATLVPTAAPTAVPAYSNGSPVSVSNIKIDWDTTSYEGNAKETATMSVKNDLNDSIVLDVFVYYKVSTPTTFIDPDGTVHNLTNTITKTENLGMMQVGDHKDLSFQVSHNKNVPAVVSVTVQWRGGSAVIFEKTLEMADHSFGTFEF